MSFMGPSDSGDPWYYTCPKWNLWSHFEALLQPHHHRGKVTFELGRTFYNGKIVMIKWPECNHWFVTDHLYDAIYYLHWGEEYREKHDKEEFTVHVGDRNFNYNDNKECNKFPRFCRFVKDIVKEARNDREKERARWN